jgi:SAM-dependent methyltransferase
MSLEKFFIESQNQSDKYDLGYISEFYDKLFNPIRNNVKKVFEIGIYQGNSIKLWHDFFVNANIYCADTARCDALENYQRVKPFYQNAYDLDFVDLFEKNSFDIIIDDGPHTYDSMVFFLSNYVDLVRPGGICILEDIIDRSWTPELLKLIQHRTDLTITVYDMRQKQKTSDLVERWKNGLDIIVIEKK